MRRPNRTGPTEGTGSEPGRADKDSNTPTLFDDGPRPRPWTDELHDLSDRRRAGEAAALEAAANYWREEAQQALEALADSGRVFTAEDCRAICGDVPGPSQNAFGALFAAASRAGLIECVGITTARRDVAAGHVLRQWRGAS